MAPTAPLVSLLGAALALAGGVSAVSCNKGGCVLDRCARAVRYPTAGPNKLGRLADCSSVLAVTVIPAASTIWATEYESAVTVTVTTAPPAWTAPTSAVSAFTLLTKRTVTASATETAVPTYVSPQCSDAAQYGSACSCWSVTGPTTTASVADVTSTTTVASTVTYYDYESPPLASSSVSFPANSWTKTYTYSEYTLPVFTSAPDPSVVVDYPTPVETCLMDAIPTGDAFYLLAPGTGYVVKREGALGPVVQPADEAEAEALLANWNPPTFKFQAAENAPDGLFDLVVSDGINPDLYVALDVDSGAISLVLSSTGGTKTQDGKCTTVFGVSCRGSLLLQYGSATYVWTTTDDSTVAAPGTPATDSTTEGLNTMLLLPARVRTPLNQTTKRRRSTGTAPGTTPWKRDYSQWGVAQRCPGFNSKMVAVSNGRAGSAPNGCGPDGAWYTAFVPNLDFGGCCTTHDICYDSCPQYFEKCNGDFLSCMINSCNNDYDHWYSSWLLPGCYAAADLYYIAVSSGTAQTHFQDGSKQLCNCNCADSDFAICAPGQKTCQKVRGVGNNDNKNCGGCNQDCGSKAHCSDAQCLCNPAAPTPNQCGNMCLDFQTHPRNCGGCGNVCASGYCYQGACFNPPPDAPECYPVNAITNGDFSNSVTGWSVTVDQYAFTWGLAAGRTAQTRAVTMSPSQYGGYPEANLQTLTVSTTLRLCPGVPYKIDFQVKASQDPWASLSIQAGTSTQYVSINGRNVWSFQGPYDLPAFNKGDPGVTEAADHSLRVPLAISFTVGREHTYSYQITEVAVYSTGS